MQLVERKRNPACGAYENLKFVQNQAFKINDTVDVHQLLWFGLRYV